MKNYKEIYMDSCENCQWVKSWQDGCLECTLVDDREPVSNYGICDLYVGKEHLSSQTEIQVDYSL